MKNNNMFGINKSFCNIVLLSMFALLGTACGGGGGGGTDTTPPTTSISINPGSIINSTNASFTFVSTEAGSTYECSLDNSAFVTCSSPTVFTGLADGSHTFHVRATDPSGNTDPTPVIHNWEIDTTSPDTTISSNPDSLTNLTDAIFAFSSTETGSSFECSIDTSAFTACPNPVTYTGLSEGNHTLSVRAIDAAGNVDITPANFNWLIDITVPDTSVISNITSPTNVNSVSFSFTATEAGSTFQCSLDGLAFVSCTSPISYTALIEGSHSFSVRAVDTAGNTDSTPADFNWLIDLGAPQTSITSGPADPTSLTSANFVFTSSEAGSSFTCSLDAAAFQSCSSPVAYSSLLEGAHTFSVKATDAVGNTDSSAAVYNWTITGAVDNASPTNTSISINNNASNALVVGRFNARLIASDNVAVTAYLITEHNTNDITNIVPPYLDPLVSDSRWVTVTASANIDITTVFPLTQTYNTGDKVELCAWFKDAEGNISSRVCDSIGHGKSWESGFGDWYADNGVWQIGTPTVVGPSACYSGSQCAGTILDDNYPNTNSALVSPSINLPSLAANEELQLRFWHWFSLALRSQSCAGCDNDYGRIYIETQTAAGVWSAATLLTSYTGSSGGVWTKPSVDLSAYAGQKVRLRFTLTNGISAGVSAGWYIDDVSIDVVAANNTLPYAEDLESGLGDWWVSNGGWQVGSSPAAGPTACYNGSSQCAGTVLDGNYPNTNSALVSPSINLPSITANEELQLRFWHWFSLALRSQSCAGCDNDYGRIYIETQTAAGVWSAATLLTSYTGSSGGVWTKPSVDLSAYAGQKVRLRFTLTNGISAGVSAGWYIDDVSIDVVAANNTLPYAEDLESGLGDWWVSNGGWQVGSPMAGPTACYNGSSQCAGTVLDSSYPNTNSALVSPSMTLPSITTGEELQLRFWHWFSFALRTQSCAGCDNDYGRVYIQTQTAAGVWSTATLLTSYAGTSGNVWTQPSVDLSAYAGQKVRLQFSLSNGISAGVSAGWYIDDVSVSVITASTVLPYSDDLDAGLGDWWVSNGGWQVGSPTAGPAACYNGSTQCAGTVLDGSYPNTNSAFISPSISLPTLVAGDEIRLRFWHWFSFALRSQSCAGCDNDYGRVYIQTQTAAGVWSTATLLTSYAGTGGVWTQPLVDLSAYAGQKVRLHFTLSNGISAGVSAGWYIDDISITVF